MYLLDAKQALKKRRTVKRKRNVLKIGKHFTESCLCFLTSNSYLFEDSSYHDFKNLIILLMKILLFVVELIKYYLQIRPAAFTTLEKSEHTRKEQPASTSHCMLINRRDFFQ